MSLFHAPLQAAVGHEPSGRCALCAASSEDVFRSTGNLDLVVPCPRCAAQIGLSCASGDDGLCSHCGDAVQFPQLPATFVVCRACIGAERASFRHQTEAGEIGWEALDAAKRAPAGAGAAAPPAPTQMAGATASAVLQIPGGTVTIDADAQWYSEHLARQDALRRKIGGAELKQLLATPVRSTWQDRDWLVCCDAFMVYVGEWTRAKFRSEAAPEDGRALFLTILGAEEGELWETPIVDGGGALVFACSRCHRKRGQADYT